ncbi:MAG: biotin--[acetyl-CoA-carboxylase] ligase [Actinomycetes bacterium]
MSRDARSGSLWADPEWVGSTGSTNADVRRRALAGEPEGLVLSADEQTEGRGRLGRSWTAPRGSGLAVSVLLRPVSRPAAQWGWLPLLVGSAVAAAVTDQTGLSIGLKWPNDVMVGDKKLGGVLVERVDTELGPAAVVGVGLNVSLPRDLLPVPSATSLLAEGVSCHRRPLLAAYLDSLEVRYRSWSAGESPRAAYRAQCSTIGREVRVMLPGGVADVLGRAVDVDASGRLLVEPDGDGGPVALSSGEVWHVR